MSDYGRSAAFINLGHLKSNIAVVRGLLRPETMIMAVVKANAYGHGIVEVARAATDACADWLCVATVAEGVALRQAEITLPVLIMGACFDAEIEDFFAYDLVPTVFDYAFAEALSKRAVRMGVTANVHVKIDTGMNRLGFKENAFDAVMNMSKLPNLHVQGIYSHFATSDGCGVFALQQYDEFFELTNRLKQHGLDIPIKHISNSGAVVHHPELGLDLVRVGVLIYGLAPCSTPHGAAHLAKLGFKPVLSLKSRVAYVKMIRAGETVGYGRSFAAKREMQIATITAGYGDGVSRQLSNVGKVRINGRLCPIVGTVCMDQLMVACDDAKIGDEVTLIGDGISSEDVAGWQNSINYEVVTTISQRVQRIYTI